MILLNCNKEQSDLNFRNNIRSVLDKEKQEGSIVSDITTTIKNRNNERHLTRTLLVTLTTELDIKL